MQEIEVSQFFLTYVLPIGLGIITTIIILLAQTYFRNTFMPWYKFKMEKSFTVKGQWKSITNPSYSSGTKYEETIYIQQLSERIWGDIFYKELIDGKDDETTKNEKHFEFEGSFADSILSATYWNPDRKQKGRGAFCLFSNEDNILEGKYSWYEPTTKKVEMGEYIWERIK